MNRDINEYFHEHCDKMLCKDCEMENDQKEEYVCYQQGRADEREGIISKLANEIDEYQRYDYPTEDYEDGFERGCEFAFEKAIEIVKQEAEQFGTDTNVGSNSWIPCSEKLPELRKDVLVTVKHTGFMGMHGYWIKTGHMEAENDWWGDCAGGEVIAWQPLPEVYKN